MSFSTSFLYMTFNHLRPFTFHYRTHHQYPYMISKADLAAWNQNFVKMNSPCMTLLWPLTVPHARARPKKWTQEQRIQVGMILTICSITISKNWQVRTLANEGHSYRKIVQRLAISYRQVRYTLNITHLIPQKPCK